jgi:hypothetical protein
VKQPIHRPAVTRFSVVQKMSDLGRRFRIHHR